MLRSQKVVVVPAKYRTIQDNQFTHSDEVLRSNLLHSSEIESNNMEPRASEANHVHEAEENDQVVIG